MQTYIIKTKKGEYYCGKTNNLLRRFKEHLKEKNPSWFGQYKHRKKISNYIIISEDYEKQIKRAGVKMIYELVHDLTLNPITYSEIDRMINKFNERSAS